MKESALIALLRGDPDQHRLGLSSLYNEDSYRLPIIALLKRKGLKADEAKSLWTDVVVKFGLLIKKDKYEDRGQLIGYLKNLAGYMMLNYLRDQRLNHTVELDLVKDAAIGIHVQHHNELKTIVEDVLAAQDAPCDEILSLWSQGYSMREIMQKLHLPSEVATRKRKHICLKKLLHYISTNQRLKELFEELQY